MVFSGAGWVDRRSSGHPLHSLPEGSGRELAAAAAIAMAMAMAMAGGGVGGRGWGRRVVVDGKESGSQMRRD